MLDPVIDPKAWNIAVTNSRVLVIDGPNVKIAVRDGHLSVTHGPAGYLTTQKIPRIPRALDRVLILANFGLITIEAQRWLNDAGIPWTQLDRSGTILAVSPPNNEDARLIRSQAYAPVTATGLEIARYILTAKLSGQANLLGSHLNRPEQAEFIRARVARIQQTENIPLCMTLEGLAAESYWKSWEGIPIPFPHRDSYRIPPHWRKFTDRFSQAGDKPRNKNATDPVNAMLNYLYAIATTECLHACHALNLSPVLGIIHADRSDRDSFVLDLLETVRPVCDRIILDMLQTGERIDMRLFAEMKDGVVRIQPPLTHQLASHATDIGEAASPHAYTIAHMLARDATGVVTIPRPKTRVTRQTSYRGYPAARLRPGVRATDVLPDDLWQEIQHLIPAHPQMGRPYACSDRDMVAVLLARYRLRCPWRQCLSIASASVHKSTATARWGDWHKRGIWDEVYRIAGQSDHWDQLTQDF